MSVKKDATGRRSVQVEVEVPGTPEQVWQAIATGPGVSSWFVPTEVDECEGGAVTAHFGPGMDSSATVTAWEPPRRFAAKSRDLGPNAPTLATEWVVEARSGGAWWCVWFTASLRAPTIGTISSKVSNPAGRPSSASYGCISPTSVASAARGFKWWALPPGRSPKHGMR